MAIDTADLLRRLRYRFSGNDGTIVLFDVGDGAGFRNRGWSDAIAMQTWPSKGLEILGFEVKASRPDWLRELDSPEKNRTWQELCDAWYIVAPKDVVKLEELPPAWGLMLPKGADGLRIASRPQLEKREKLKSTIPRELVAAIFRAAGNERDWAQRRNRDEIRAEERENLKTRIDSAEEAAREHERQYKELAGALGGYWESLDKLKSRAAVVRKLDDVDAKRQIEMTRERLERTVEILKAAEAAVDGE